MLTRIEVREPVTHVVWAERVYYEDDVDPCRHCRLEFAPPIVRELERTPTGWTCLLFTYYQPAFLTDADAELAAARFRRFTPLPKWLPWVDLPGGEPRLPTDMVRVRIESGDVAEIDAWRYDPEHLNARRLPL
jgi:hypothetical protein